LFVGLQEKAIFWWRFIGQVRGWRRPAGALCAGRSRGRVDVLRAYRSEE
jgi:hypothetical protein